MNPSKSLALILICDGIANSFSAQSSKTDSLALKLQNPVATLAQLLVNTDYNYGFDPYNGNRTLITAEPVISFKLSQNGNMVFRLVAPFVTQSDIIAERENQTGLRDFNLIAFFVPRSKGLIFGFGPVIDFPTATI